MPTISVQAIARELEGVTRMRRDEANAIVSDLRNLARSSHNDPEIAPETIAAVGRLAGLLGQWARLPPPLREV